MKKYIFKILSIFTLLLTSIFVISSPKVSAASSNYTTGYHIATQFTFTSDIDIEDGFYTIQQEILFYKYRTSLYSTYICYIMSYFVWHSISSQC